MKTGIGSCRMYDGEWKYEVASCGICIETVCCYIVRVMKMGVSPFRSRSRSHLLLFAYSVGSTAALIQLPHQRGRCGCVCADRAPEPLHVLQPAARGHGGRSPQPAAEITAAQRRPVELRRARGHQQGARVPEHMADGDYQGHGRDYKGAHVSHCLAAGRTGAVQ